MKFSVTFFGFLTVTLFLVDINPTDGDLRIGLGVSWK